MGPSDRKSISFTVCTFNMGSSVGDYLQLCRYKGTLPEFKSQEQEANFLSKYRLVQIASAKQLIDKHIDVLCLQEVGNYTRPLAQSLKENEYQLVHIEKDIFDAAIAFNTKRFKEVRNHSKEIQISRIFKKDVAMASATDTLTGKRVLFVSAHVPGFNFVYPVEEEVEEGDTYCKEIGKAIDEMVGPTFAIIGADMNGHPENAAARFTVFKDREFHIFRTHRPTNVLIRDGEPPEREIDFLFVKEAKKETKLGSIFSAIASSLFASDFPLRVELDTDLPFDWDVEKNASDHLPVVIRVT